MEHYRERMKIILLHESFLHDDCEQNNASYGSTVRVIPPFMLSKKINHLSVHMSLIAFRIVQMTSPNLNYFIIVGSYILYASVFVRLIPSTDKTVNYVRCNVCDTILCVHAYGLLIYRTVADFAEHFSFLSYIWHSSGQNESCLPHL